jgi:hypothetical protein
MILFKWLNSIKLHKERKQTIILKLQIRRLRQDYSAGPKILQKLATTLKKLPKFLKKWAMNNRQLRPFCSSQSAVKNKRSTQVLLTDIRKQQDFCLTKNGRRAYITLSRPMYITKCVDKKTEVLL